MMEKIEILKEKIKNAKSIAICGHKNPDGDSLCSALALMQIIKLNFNKDATVIYDGSIPRVLDGVPLRKSAVFWDKIPSDSKFDLFILVDYGTRKHLGDIESFVNSAGFVVEFDHHYNDDKVGMLCFDDEQMAAAAQIIYAVANKAGFVTDKNILDLFMLGIVTDTGHFKFVRNSNVFVDSAKLVDSGVSMPDVCNVLNNRDKKTVLVEAKAVSNTEFFMSGRLAIAVIDAKDYKQLDGRGELVLSLLGQVHGVEYIVLLKEHRENLVGISFRSKQVPINEIAESFGGGGHLFAAGAVVEGGLDEVKNKVLEAFKEM